MRGLSAIAIAGLFSASLAQGAGTAPLAAPPAPAPEVSRALELRATKCEALKGDAKRRCEREARASAPPGAPGTGSCDALTGPDKERCIRQGGTVTTSAGATTGGSSSETTPDAGARPHPR